MLMIIFSLPSCVFFKLLLHENSIVIIILLLLVLPPPPRESEFPFSTITDPKYNSLVWEHKRTNKMLFSEYTGKCHLLLLLENTKRIKDLLSFLFRKVLLKLNCLHTNFGFNEKKNHFFYHFFITTNFWNGIIFYEFLFGIELSPVSFFLTLNDLMVIA